jgi:hypothetical protein
MSTNGSDDRHTASGGETVRKHENQRRKHNFENASLRLLRKAESRPPIEPREDREAERRRELAKRILVREIITAILLVIASAGTMLLTYFGVSTPMSEAGASIISKGQALSFSILIGVLSWLGWSYIFGVLHLLTGKRLAVALSAGAIYVLFIAAIDAQFNMLALAGSQAVQRSLVATAESYEQARSDVAADATIASQLVPAVRSQVSRFASLQTSEIDNGTHSGRTGAGRVSDAFGQVAILLAELADQVDQAIPRVGALQGKVTDLLAEMKSHAFTIGDVRPRARDVSATADQIDALFAEVAQYDYRASIRATLDSLENLFPTQGAASGFAAVQNTEVAAVGELAKPVASSLRSALTNMGKDGPGLNTRRPLDAMTAVKVYWLELLPQWIAAIFIDIAPAFLVIILVAARRESDL